MSPISPPERDVVGARSALVVTARRDLGAAMALAVPFVLNHPAEASVLRELAAIADQSVADAVRFRSGVRDLLRAALHADRDGPADSFDSELCTSEHAQLRSGRRCDREAPAA